MNGNCSLEQILRFVTGITWEPLFGFAMDPAIHFTEKHSKNDMYPTSSTCANILYLPYSMTFLLNDEVQYQLYDMAFMNTYFGLG